MSINYERISLVADGSNISVAPSKTVIVSTGPINGRDALWFAATNSDVSQTFNGNVEISANGSNWIVTNYGGLKNLAPGASVAVRVDIFGHRQARITGTASGAGLTLTNVYSEMQKEFT